MKDISYKQAITAYDKRLKSINSAHQLFQGKKAEKIYSTAKVSQITPNVVMTTAEPQQAPASFPKAVKGVIKTQVDAIRNAEKKMSSSTTEPINKLALLSIVTEVQASLQLFLNAKDKIVEGCKQLLQTPL